MLDALEQERAAQLRFEADRRAFIVAHALRRLALGMALAVDPRDLGFGLGPHGQPVLLHATTQPLHFSLTRSRGLVACAVSVIGPVGIDVEPLRDDADPELLGTFMDAAAGSEGALAFYQQWTALEAFWKARGLGLSASHPRIRLQPSDDSPDCFEVVYGESQRPTGMLAIRLPSPAGHVLSLACGEVTSVRLVDFERLAGRPGAMPRHAATCDSRCEYAAAPPIDS